MRDGDGGGGAGDRRVKGTSVIRSVGTLIWTRSTSVGRVILAEPLFKGIMGDLKQRHKTVTLGCLLCLIDCV